jgi:hypothetical protein
MFRPNRGGRKKPSCTTETTARDEQLAVCVSGCTLEVIEIFNVLNRLRSSSVHGIPEFSECDGRNLNICRWEMLRQHVLLDFCTNCVVRAAAHETMPIIQLKDKSIQRPFPGPVLARCRWRPRRFLFRRLRQVDDVLPVARGSVDEIVAVNLLQRSQLAACVVATVVADSLTADATCRTRRRRDYGMNW